MSRVTHFSPARPCRAPGRLSMRLVPWALLTLLVTAIAPAFGAPSSSEVEHEAPSLPVLGEEVVLEPRGFPSPAAPPLPDPAIYPIQLVLDDDSAEGVFGILGGTARQFLWFNTFSSPGDFRLEEVWVLFPNGPDVPLGGDVQLVVYLDPDQDPSTGAELLATYDVTIQATDGSTFSVYPLGSPLEISGSGDVMIGVVNRYYMTGVDPPPTEPAAVDTTAGQGRSYFALWAGDAPAMPDLASATTIGVLDGASAGNHMIRGFGGPLPAVNIPSLNGIGLMLLTLALGLAGLGFAWRSRH